MSRKTTTIFIYASTLCFLIYSFFALKHKLVIADILSIVVGIATMIFFIFSCKTNKNPTENSRIYSKLAVFYCVCWIIFDSQCIWSYYNSSPIDFKFINILHLGMSVSMLTPIVMVFVKKLRFLSRRQFLINLIAIGLCLYYVVESFYTMTNKDNQTINFNPHIVFCIVSLDILVVLLMFMSVAVFKIRFFYKMNTSKIFTLMLISYMNSLRVYSSVLSENKYFVVFGAAYILTFLVLSQTLLIMNKDDERTVRISREKKLSLLNKTITSTIIFLFCLCIFLETVAFFSDTKGNIGNIFSIFFATILYLVATHNEKEDILQENAKLLDLSVEKEYQYSKSMQKIQKDYDEIIHYTRIDALTNLYNRKYLMELFEEFDQNCHSGRNLTVFVIDIVQFKTINEITNHKTGDLILIEIANTLREMFPFDKVFRTDSNQFTILIDGISLNMYDLSIKSRDIVNLLTSPLDIDEHIPNLEIAIGCDSYRFSIKSHVDIYKNAEYACKFAKENFVKSFSIKVFDDEIANLLETKVQIDSLLHRIDFDSEFIMYYQPQFDVDGEKLIGVEALIRWYSPVMGQMVPPKDFIPIAETSNVILKLVRFTLVSAVKQIKKWNNHYGTDLKMSINISPKYLHCGDFIDEIEEFINIEGVKPSWLEFEITENSIMMGGNKIIAFFEKLSEMGIGASIDDFGTGYSSLAYIKNFKISKIKIAKELIETIDMNVSEQEIVEAIVKMSESLGINTIAEGVEKVEQVEKLKEAGCREIQGFLYGRPVPASEFEKLYLTKQFAPVSETLSQAVCAFQY